MKRFLSIIACLALCFALCVPAFAADAPAVPAFSSQMQSLIDEHGLKSIVMYNTSNKFFNVLLIQNSDDVYVVQKTDTVAELRKNSDKTTIYTATFYYDGVWDCNAKYGANTWFNGRCYWSLTEDQFLVSDGTTADVRYQNGDAFFPTPRPLAEQLQAQAGDLTQTQIAETLDFLVPLGIGLLASVASLILLRKVFRTFP